MSMITSEDALPTLTVIAPAVPAGTIAALAIVWLAAAQLSVETFGSVAPVGHTLRNPNGLAPVFVTVMLSEYAPAVAGIPVQTGWVGTGMSRLLSAASVGGPNAPVWPALRVSMIRQGVIAMKGRGAEAAAAASGERARSVPRRDIMD